ncbi:MAG: hypothetical protein K0R18_1294 [Bacillales bacterium]|jgi:hypothetical protein|nr:hypothetical protein [Bacillales bacterium]
MIWQLQELIEKIDIKLLYINETILNEHIKLVFAMIVRNEKGGKVIHQSLVICTQLARDIFNETKCMLDSNTIIDIEQVLDMFDAYVTINELTGEMI